jgi:integrase
VDLDAGTVAARRNHLGEWAGTERRVHLPRLRHTGQTLAAAAGATLKDLMKRLGHSSQAAANRYLHAVEGRDAEIAAALS